MVEPSLTFDDRIANKDQNILVQPQAFIAQQNNFDCSKLITKDQINMPAAAGYTVQLANPFNSTDVSFSCPLMSIALHPYFFRFCTPRTPLL